jgi:hypothetical protein
MAPWTSSVHALASRAEATVRLVQTCRAAWELPPPASDRPQRDFSVQPRTTPGEGRFCRHRGAGGDGIVKERDRQGIVVQQQRQLGARRIRVAQPEPTHV